MASTLHSGNNTRFNAEAAAWDANPDVHRASDGALQALLSVYSPSSSSSLPIPIHLTSTNPTVDVLEIGCGTGLLSFRLAPYVRSILAIDAAEGMIAALEAKLEESAATKNNITPLNILLEDAEDPRLPSGEADATTAALPGNPRKKFHLITSHLVLHHIPTSSLPALLQTMYNCLQPGGEVALTDYQDVGPDAIKFHPAAKMDGVESPRGIDAAWFAGLMRDAGFARVEVGPAWTMEKDVERFPGEWGGLDDGKPFEKPSIGDLAKMGFPFLLCRGRKKEA